MKKLLFATALLTALFLSACGSQKADSNDLANQPATRPEEGAELDPEFSVDGEDTGETAEPQPDAELSEMADAIYNVQPVDLMGMETVAIDLTDESWYGYLAGLTADNVDKVDAAVVSEPMTGSQAYSLVLLRLKDKADAREIADSMEENISMRKWVCVEADKARVVSFDDKLLYVMADSELVDVDLLADAAAKAFNATFDVDDSLVNEDESELPPELLSAPAVAESPLGCGPGGASPAALGLPAEGSRVQGGPEARRAARTLDAGRQGGAFRAGRRTRAWVSAWPWT